MKNAQIKCKEAHRLLCTASCFKRRLLETRSAVFAGLKQDDPLEERRDTNVGLKDVNMSG